VNHKLAGMLMEGASSKDFEQGCGERSMLECTERALEKGAGKVV
jgi:hypothetical protein